MISTTMTSPDNEEAELMKAEVFEITVGQLTFHGARLETPKVVQAARAVLVEGKRPGEAATQYEIAPERVSEAVGRIREKWDAICAERGLITETFSLSPNVISLIKLIEKDTLEPLQADLAMRKKKSPAPKKVSAIPKPTLLKVAEKKPRTYKKKVAPKK
ncbi:MAG TPA: hypothetical protein VLC91_03130 [Spongiibacteraceae bacterium]|nr:hypothetical protein [Spongiibacteraceae bacterium]